MPKFLVLISDQKPRIESGENFAQVAIREYNWLKKRYDTTGMSIHKIYHDSANQKSAKHKIRTERMRTSFARRRLRRYPTSKVVVYTKSPKYDPNWLKEPTRLLPSNEQNLIERGSIRSNRPTSNECFGIRMTNFIRWTDDRGIILKCLPLRPEKRSRACHNRKFANFKKEVVNLAVVELNCI